MRFSFRSLKLSHLVVVVSLVATIILTFESKNLSQLSSLNFKQTQEEQHKIRSVLQCNLMVQRAFALNLTAINQDNPAMLKRSVNLMMAAEGFIKSYKYFQIPDKAHLISEVEEISRKMEHLVREYSHRGESIPQDQISLLQALVDHLYAELSDAEVENWEKLALSNASLETRINRHLLNHSYLAAFLFFLSALFIWLLIMRQKAETALRRGKDKLEIRVKERTAELHDQIKIRMKAEQSLQANEMLLQSIVENIPSMIFVKDAKSLRFARINRAGEKLLGYSREELIGKNDYDFFTQAEADFFVKHDKEALRRKKLFDIPEESVQTRHMGKKILHTQKIPIFDEAGKPLYLLGISEDITNQRRAEEEKKAIEDRLLQAQKMEAIGTLAGGVAHDFNNILTPIIGYADLALQMLEPTDSVAHSLNAIMKAGDRAKQLVQQILTFSRQERQVKHLLAPHVIIKESLKLLRASLPTTIEIKEEVPSNCGLVMGDPIQLQQIIMNLCTNAYHAMRKQGGILAVSMKQTDIREIDKEALSQQMPAGSYIEIEVSDTGTGIDKETIKKIFEPYFTTKIKGEGTGLGLATVHGIVKSCGGHISVYSEPGQGTTFHVYLPREHSPEEEKPPSLQSKALPLGTGHVMLVDDEKEIANMLINVLERLGYQVSSFTDSEEALVQFSKHPGRYDILITDMTMPNKTGLELSIQALEIRPDLPIILCTGFSDLINKEDALSLGIRDFLTKPVTIQNFAASVKKALDKKDPDPDSRT